MHWGGLPLPASLACLSEYGSRPSVLTTSRAVWRALIGLHRVVFGVVEWRELVSGYWDGRANPASYCRWCEFKAITPSWRLDRREAVGVIGDPRGGPVGATVGEVLAGWGVELCAVLYSDDVPGDGAFEVSP